MPVPDTLLPRLLQAAGREPSPSPLVWACSPLPVRLR